jgi:hypothetical protein
MSGLRVRWAILVASSVIASIAYVLPAVAGEMTAEEAKRFVSGKLFAYSCFEGTSGAGRIYADGSVVGSIQLRGAGPVRYVALPAGTLRVKGESYCASMRGLPFEPCFNVDKTSHQSFRGSVYGFGFAACEFTRRSARVDLAGTPLRLNPIQATGSTSPSKTVETADRGN